MLNSQSERLSCEVAANKKSWWLHLSPGHLLQIRLPTEIKLTRDLVETNNWGKSERKGNESEAVGEKLLVLNNLKGKNLDLEVWLLT